jgi:hypothetical protein
MLEVGNSPGAIKTLKGGVFSENVPWASVAAPVFRGSGASSVRLPNKRVQRTRSSPSALRSPLTRCPFGG